MGRTGKTKKQHRQERGGKRPRRDASQELSPVEQIMQGVDRLTDQFKQRIGRMVKSQITGMDDKNAAVKNAARELVHALGDQFSTRARRLATTSPFKRRRR